MRMEPGLYRFPRFLRKAANHNAGPVHFFETRLQPLPLSFLLADAGNLIGSKKLIHLLWMRVACVPMRAPCFSRKNLQEQGNMTFESFRRSQNKFYPNKNAHPDSDVNSSHFHCSTHLSAATRLQGGEESGRPALDRTQFVKLLLNCSWLITPFHAINQRLNYIEKVHQLPIRRQQIPKDLEKQEEG